LGERIRDKPGPPNSREKKMVGITKENRNQCLQKGKRRRAERDKVEAELLRG